MARTSQPHQRSKLFFALRFLQDLDYLHRLVSPYLSPEDYAELRPGLNRAEARFCDRRNTVVRDLLRAGVERRMLDASVSPVVLAEPRVQAFIAAEAERDRCVRLAFEKRPPVPPPLDDYWRPDRIALSRIVVGEHLVFGRGNRVVTANRLNDGIPTRDDGGYGIDGDAVRNALVTIVGRHRLYEDEALARDAFSAMHQAVLLDFVWTGLQPRLQTVEGRKAGAVDRLIAEGVPLDLFMDAQDVVPEPNFTPETVRELFRGRRELVMRELRWRRRHNAFGPRPAPARYRRRFGP